MVDSAANTLYSVGKRLALHGKLGLKIAYCSDLHFEFFQQGWMPELPVDVDVLILAGDIGKGRKAVSVVERIASKLRGVKIIFVAGNHDLYGESVDVHFDILRTTFVKSDQIHFLEKESVDINGISFLGCTLWSGFDVLGEEGSRFAIDGVAGGLADFHQIKNRFGGELLHPMTMAHLYRESRMWLEARLKTAIPEKTVVITHWPPCREVRNKSIPEDIYAAYFQANCRDLIEKYQPSYWVYGHNHWSDVTRIGSTTLLSNQGGYPNENGRIPGYAQQMNFEI